MKRFTIVFYVISLFLCCFAFCFAGDLKITQVDSQNNQTYDIIINNAVAVYGITVKTKNGSDLVEFPVYAANGKVYKQFSLLKREYGEYLLSSLKKKQTDADYKGGTDFKINKFSRSNRSGNIKAFASVIFEDCLEVECRVMSGKNGIWIAWPSNKKGEEWQSNFSFTDKKLKKLVESGLISKYNNKDERK